MMRRFLLPVLVPFALSSLGGCGDDGTMTVADSSVPSDEGTASGDNCDRVPGAPDPNGLMGSCCYRTDHGPDTLNFRLSALGVTSPDVLASPVVAGLLGPALNEERFNWLFRVEGAGADGDVSLTTGFAFRDPGPVFRFSNGDAPTDAGDPSRWDPATTTGTLSADTMTTPPSATPITVPIFDAEGTAVTTELPLRNLELTFANLSEAERCVGAFTPNAVWDTSEGEVQAFITVEDAIASNLDVPPTIDTTLCNLIAGLTNDMGCEVVTQDMWDASRQPDSMCDGAGSCTEGSCDPATTCNAWRLRAGFAAQAVPAL